ncbi:flagellar basal body rod protein FlgB [Desulfotalea psychrophila]|uniref:Flagellar basal body rod protein FlgB n=1 Tax=Desulfotalea psychrophila (strain LSv54 / DSM 12343) TaxID=177439 RepID=Q6AJU4_DESPS|nr:flagellar basal body rod protein FlgB [Desulfotalea psychrophila]CAG37382.1 related to flagellar basal-body rod protein (FlgB) [Desulfotalea psychrophila LSv54]
MKLLEPFDNQIRLLGKVLDLRASKQEVISSNIANAETPGYAARRFNFEEDLQKALSLNSTELTTSNPRHIPLGASTFSDLEGTTTIVPDKHGIGDSNSVSMRDEMLALSENQLLYETSAQLLKKKLGMVKYAISGGQ